MDSPKYNRTFHVPWSPGATSDDKIASSIDSLLNKPIVITEKMDGSNTSLEREGCFARTHANAPTHPSFDALKALHAVCKWQIPENIQLFGEWCFAVHSIEYVELPHYFLLFNVRDLNNNTWASWEEVKLWAEEIQLNTVPVLFEGTVTSEKELQQIIDSFMIKPSACGGIREGIVVRIQDSFTDQAFPQSIMKCVRANHVQTSEHWKNQEIIKNKLRIVS
jgi:hypothetical protein